MLLSVYIVSDLSDEYNVFTYLSHNVFFKFWCICNDCAPSKWLGLRATVLRERCCSDGHRYRMFMLAGRSRDIFGAI